MIDFIGKRKYFFGLSIILILLGIVFLFINGLELDIQFQGGTLLKVEMPDDTFDADEIAVTVGNELNKAVTAQKMKTFNPDNAEEAIDMLMLKVSSKDALSDDEISQVINLLREKYNVKPDAQNQVQSVQPFIGQEMLKDGLLAAIISSVAIIFYVWWRYRIISGLSAAVMALVALFHDILIMFLIYPVFRIPVNESFIAAMLTILGYSVNDTIIVYDRIRENRKLYRKADLKELVNMSTTQTLSRSINTTITTLTSVVCVYIFASVNNIQSLKEFTFPLIIGLVSGSYSSIFIASPLWEMWQTYRAKKVVPGKAAKAR